MPGKQPSSDQLFDQLAEAAVQSSREEDRDETAVERRLWTLAETVPVFYHRAITPAERAQLSPDIRRLRRRAVKRMNQLPAAQRRRKELEQQIEAAAERFDFRPWRFEDLEIYRTLLSDEELWKLLPEEYPGPLDEETARGLISHSNHAPQRHEVFAVETEGEVVGQVRLQFDSDDDEASAEISYWLGREFWGRGIASKVVPLFTKDSFVRHSRIERIFARVLHGNVGSLKVLERGRYRHERFRHAAIRRGGKSFGEHVLSVFRADYPLG